MWVEMGKAAGVDGISYELLKAGVEVLVDIMNIICKHLGT